ncbi:MAG: FAD-binding oxidoreductase [candidate division Zixibacteria bacterium]|nr:FAD-binding oxidoreductase [candidate division Zixibacteria bacterium]
MDYLNSKATLEAYSSDSSIYTVAPKLVRLVNSTGDIVNTLQFAGQNGMTVTPRGGGTGVVGGALGAGIILDFSNFKKIMEVDTDNRTVVTQVGIIYDELNLFLRKSGLYFPPDPSSGDSCQIGGMLAGNSSGPSSLKYGLTSDFVEELSVIKPSGQQVIA